MDALAPEPRPIGSFLLLLPTDRRVAPLEDRAGWLRVRGDDRDVLLATDTIVGVERVRTQDGAKHTWIQRRDGSTLFCGDVDPIDILLAMDEANGEGPGALPPLPKPPGDLLARVVQRRDALARLMANVSQTEELPLRTLGLLRDEALHLATHVSHPRDWILLVRDAAFEAAAELLLCDSLLAADRFCALGRQLERDVRALPAAAPAP
jgi:hypothetical protein